MGTMAEESEGVRSIRRALDILSLLTDDTAVHIGPRHRGRPPACRRRRCCAWCRRWSTAGLLWATAGGYMPVPACGAGRTWPGEAGSSRRKPRRMMRDLGTRHARNGEPVRAARHQPGVGRAAGVAAAAAARRRPSATNCRCGAARRPRCCCATRRSPCSPDRAPVARRRGPPRNTCGNGSPRPPAGRGTRSATANRGRACPRWPYPVTGRSGAVVAALALSGPTLRFTAERVDRVRRRPPPGRRAV